MIFSSRSDEKMGADAIRCFGRRRTVPGTLRPWPKYQQVPPAVLPRYTACMSEILDLAAIAALVGDPARANILVALLDGRALTASELAYAAHVTPQTASGHLGKLARARLISVAQQGRHRYFRLAGPHVAQMLESISAVAAITPPRLRPIRIDDTMRKAR